MWFDVCTVAVLINCGSYVIYPRIVYVCIRTLASLRPYLLSFDSYRRTVAIVPTPFSIFSTATGSSITAVTVYLCGHWTA